MITENFLANLNCLLKRERLSQLALSKVSGISQGTINKWYNRKTIPPPKTIEKLCEFFNVKAHFFFMEPGTQDRPMATHTNEFKIFLDAIAEKELSPVDLESYHFQGGANCFVRQMRDNYENPDGLAMQDWYLQLVKIVDDYASIDLLKKVRDRMEKKRDKKNDSESA